MRANAWMVKQVLARGSTASCSATPKRPAPCARSSSRALSAGDPRGRGGGLGDGGRSGDRVGGTHLGDFSAAEYMRKADTWPLNPEGELFLGLKIENKRALANAEASLAVPGIAFAEWGPGDMGISLGFADRHDPPYPPEMAGRRARVLAGCKANNLAFLNQTRPHDVVEMIAEGVRIGAGGREAREIGRAHTGRTMLW